VLKIERGLKTIILVFKKTRDLLGGRLKAMIAGGAPVEAKTQQFMSICMSCPLVIGYGLTETCAAGAVQVTKIVRSSQKLSFRMRTTSLAGELDLLSAAPKSA